MFVHLGVCDGVFSVCVCLCACVYTSLELNVSLSKSDKRTEASFFYQAFCGVYSLYNVLWDVFIQIDTDCFMSAL